ncbi:MULTISPECIES: RAQPRD family integrative conjugative element protein [unclassified Modicisalibacter]|uniref:integrative conjugative element protein, RAQPRD family n=1 Tax=unclassified Modicisalibacter TaxID=2679913 RepID=UPI001CCB4274|nr:MULTISPECIES: RAQPRD family integrative conjugative element protein [unclassified Modicisalibacter]MBZ9559057.1 RAQPRD family integrative conjugative element protein [Modicisalibacter sp. R2A 31.J]MBZ9576832.1 RAQPRD family integrative conjugative element protein [Modicisalibacter sp. MOD 31.J]
MTVHPKRFHVLLGGLVASIAGVSSPASATDIDEIQRRDLALIQTQIEQIEVVVDRIDARQQQADPATTRIYFDIPRLRADLESIVTGIDSYLSPERPLPRRPRPIDGDYLDDKGA